MNPLQVSPLRPWILSRHHANQPLQLWWLLSPAPLVKSWVLSLVISY